MTAVYNHFVLSFTSLYNYFTEYMNWKLNLMFGIMFLFIFIAYWQTSYYIINSKKPYSIKTIISNTMILIGINFWYSMMQIIYTINTEDVIYVTFIFSIIGTIFIDIIIILESIIYGIRFKNKNFKQVIIYLIKIIFSIFTPSIIAISSNFLLNQGVLNLYFLESGSMLMQVIIYVSLIAIGIIFIETSGPLLEPDGWLLLHSNKKRKNK